MQLSIYIFALLVLALTRTYAQSQPNGHYRCHWYPGPATAPIAGVIGSQPVGNQGNQGNNQDNNQSPQCTQDDAESLKSLVGQCTGQNFQHANICEKNQTWDCNEFFGVCKTLIRSDDPPRIQPMDSRESMAESCKRLFGSNIIPSNTAQTGVAQSAQTYPGDTDAGCPRDVNLFTLKDLSLAVLISFITGATMLAIVIFVVWKCRNTKWEMEQRKLAILQKVQSLAALQHIMAVTSGRHDVESGHFMNPNYAQVLASNTLVEELIGDQDKLYEEIMTEYRDSSLRKKEDTLYTKVDKRKKNADSTTAAVTTENKGVENVVAKRESGDDTDSVDAAEDETELSNVISCATDSGYQEEGSYESVDTGTLRAGDRPTVVFTIDPTESKIH